MKNDFTIFKYHFKNSLAITEYFETRYPRLVKRWDNDLTKLLDDRVSVNGVQVKTDYIFQIGDKIEFKHFRSDEEQIKKIDILFENEDLIAVEKPSGYPVVPNTDFHFNSITHYLRELNNNNEISPLHRLDLETSGVLVFSKKIDCRGTYQKMFQDRKVDKSYTAIVNGHFPNDIYQISGKIVKDEDSKIFSKLKLIRGNNETVTLIKSVNYLSDNSVIKLKPVTGFRNQIRVHLASLGYPILNDKKYNIDEMIYLHWLNTDRALENKRLMLHCDQITIAGITIKSQVKLENIE